MCEDKGNKDYYDKEYYEDQEFFEFEKDYFKNDNFRDLANNEPEITEDNLVEVFVDLLDDVGDMILDDDND